MRKRKSHKERREAIQRRERSKRISPDGTMAWLMQPQPHYGLRMTFDYLIVSVFITGIIGIIWYLTLR